MWPANDQLIATKNRKLSTQWCLDANIKNPNESEINWAEKILMNCEIDQNACAPNADGWRMCYETGDWLSTSENLPPKYPQLRISCKWGNIIAPSPRWEWTDQTMLPGTPIQPRRKREASASEVKKLRRTNWEGMEGCFSLPSNSQWANLRLL